MKYASNNIRNILIAGHAGSGKTTLTEALVYFSGAAERMGRVEDGTTISDFDPEEAKRKASLSASVVPVEYEGIKYNLIDAPGLFDFEAGEYEGIRAAESVLVCVSGRSGVTVGAEKAFQLARKNGKATMVFISKCDLENANYFKILEEMKIKFGSTVCPCVVPVRLDDGTVLRVSVSTATVGALLLGVTQPMLAVLAAALILSAILAKHISRRVVAPLNELDLEHPLDDSNAAYEELAPVLGRINRQRSQINSQLRELRRRTDEFAQVTGSMREGLVLLNEQGYILSMNLAARNIFAVEGDCAGKDFLTVDRSCDMSAAVRSAMESGHGRLHERHGGRIYQVDVSRIDSDGAAIGTVILVFDVTEQESAEQMRREFTANVSHELKTPLQGIIGSAELIENGMVQPEDMPRFVGHIRAEAQRLVTLIGDIIRLSQLDEGEVLPKERLDLLEVAQGAADDLQAEAEKKNVHLSVSGEPAELEGVRQLIYEVAYNLGDNAIKYNVDGGSVSINVSSDGKNAKLTVSDTGIGIAAEDQSRIFERFYRVDKSHSKESGGTGLGLSIVKHAVQYHGGRISMDSAPGKGTSISVSLPIQ